MIVGTHPNADHPATVTQSGTEERRAPRVSVIIPARDAELTIATQLAATCSQAAPAPFEVLVVDNGSVDGTADVVRRLAATNPQIRLTSGPLAPNRSAARNLGAAEAHGEVLLFCDADDIVEPGWMRALVQALEHHPVVTGVLVRARHGEATADDAAPTSTGFRGITCLGSANFAISRSLLLDVGGFSPDFRHRVDVELSCRLLARHGVQVRVEPAARVLYVRRATLRSEARQHFWWSVADVHIQKTYRGSIDFEYSWRNSVKHWLLAIPRLVAAAARGRDISGPTLTLASLVGRLVGSIRYRTWAI